MRLLASFTPNLRLATDSARSPNCSTIASPALTSTSGRTGPVPSDARGHPAGERGADDAADKPRPGLARAPARRQPRPAEQPPDRIGADIGRPDHGEHPQQGRPPGVSLCAQPQQEDAGQRHPQAPEPPVHSGAATRAAVPRPRQTRQRADTRQDSPGREPPATAAADDRQSQPHRSARDPATAQAGPIPTPSPRAASDGQQSQPRPAEPDRRQRQRRQDQRRQHAQPQRRPGLSESQPTPRSAARGRR